MGHLWSDISFQARITSITAITLGMQVLLSLLISQTEVGLEQWQVLTVSVVNSLFRNNRSTFNTT